MSRYMHVCLENNVTRAANTVPPLTNNAQFRLPTFKAPNPADGKISKQLHDVILSLDVISVNQQEHTSAYS